MSRAKICRSRRSKFHFARTFHFLTGEKSFLAAPPPTFPEDPFFSLACGVREIKSKAKNRHSLSLSLGPNSDRKNGGTLALFFFFKENYRVLKVCAGGKTFSLLTLIGGNYVALTLSLHIYILLEPGQRGREEEEREREEKMKKVGATSRGRLQRFSFFFSRELYLFSRFLYRPDMNKGAFLILDSPRKIRENYLHS